MNLLSTFYYNDYIHYINHMNYIDYMTTPTLSFALMFFCLKIRITLFQPWTFLPRSL